MPYASIHRLRSNQAKTSTIAVVLCSERELQSCSCPHHLTVLTVVTYINVIAVVLGWERIGGSAAA
jgi:hypothetical protein